MRLHDDTVRQVKERAKILDVFEGETLKKQGAEYLAFCPWHEDTHPSLGVSPKKNFAYCPVCARHASPIDWVMDRQGLSFIEAVEQLAKKYNVEIKAANPEDAERLAKENKLRAMLYEKREREELDFHDALFYCEEAKDYFKGRGIVKETAEAWRLGWDASERRVVFPLKDQQGRTIAFTKRTLSPDVKPKYKNSLNDILYQKSKLIYGLDLARSEIVRTGQVVIVEGQMDVILLWQNGVKNAVAVSGSVLTGEMVKGLIRSTRISEVVLCFDGDTGGEKAQQRAVTALQGLALSGEIELKILLCPSQTDPADNAEIFADQLLPSAVSWVEFMFERAIEKLDLSNPSTLAQAERGVRQILKELPAGPMRAWVQKRSKEVLSSVPKVAPAVVLTRQQQDRCDWTELRAVRLLLFSDREDYFEVIQSLPFQTEIAAELLANLSLAAEYSPQKRRTFFAELCKQHGDLYDTARQLIKPIHPVRISLEESAQDELEHIFEVLATECCPDDDGKANATGEEK